MSTDGLHREIAALRENVRELEQRCARERVAHLGTRRALVAVASDTGCDVEAASAAVVPFPGSADWRASLKSPPPSSVLSDTLQDTIRSAEISMYEGITLDASRAAGCSNTLCERRLTGAEVEAARQAKRAERLIEQLSQMEKALSRSDASNDDLRGVLKAVRGTGSATRFEVMAEELVDARSDVLDMERRIAQERGRLQEATHRIREEGGRRELYESELRKAEQILQQERSARAEFQQELKVAREESRVLCGRVSKWESAAVQAQDTANEAVLACEAAEASKQRWITKLAQSEREAAGKEEAHQLEIHHIAETCREEVNAVMRAARARDESSQSAAAKLAEVAGVHRAAEAELQEELNHQIRETERVQSALRQLESSSQAAESRWARQAAMMSLDSRSQKRLVDDLKAETNAHTEVVVQLAAARRARREGSREMEQAIQEVQLLRSELGAAHYQRSTEMQRIASEDPGMNFALDAGLHSRQVMALTHPGSFQWRAGVEDSDFGR
mmetsp:Transcript_12413/g.27673  ORF Transcript_12413/g.27673 Transcript_12413/m.27673 type:complete len:505 (+) Transcript_12413:1-1515(+)